ncbi:DUF6913 domain-containing protein [Cecembia calidifontis]|jgi:hypothetical protein|uniref:Uncharacterized protein n=1 Tax=Cecembia calidifontis TaxID=1187080 RepID=A0A4Q7PD77_9BACT|nr:hypothetical protein [Cecembia calidifontis]RZS98195.1 hypothetical protein BC751_3835 [Cecembia calidifontis]
MKWIKDWMVKRQVNAKLHMLKAKDVRIPQEIKTIGIIAASSADFELTKETVRQLWGYKVRVIGFYYEENKDQPVDSMSYKHFDLLGNPTAYFNAFMTEKLDIILVPSLHLNPYLRYLLLSNKCNFNLGFYTEENEPYLDLMLQYGEGDLEKNIYQLINYLHKIQEAC